jgi:putative transposase
MDRAEPTNPAEAGCFWLELSGKGKGVPRWRLFYHLVWATKGREPLIEELHHVTLQRTLRSSGHDQHALIHVVGIMPDHVHVVASIPPSISIASFVGQLKGSSSRFLNRDFFAQTDTTFGWQGKYSVLSFGEKALPDVIAYAENQRARHASRKLWPSLEQTEEDS